MQKYVERTSKSEKSVDEDDDKKRLTNIPFFDIIHENINPGMKEKLSES